MGGWVHAWAVCKPLRMLAPIRGNREGRDRHTRCEPSQRLALPGGYPTQQKQA